ncbi:hypothetical protein FF011L_06260 [Roseimaritima multifibrata]|uniref:Uncharacterized protein n=1 Tax=Roseimaritima multifibrata TaxID=1930274 RepID=A0A517MAH0_9BACT|nr:hypothetical protein [Roseimaritima multifibrata]QDS91890.1 hypothetical protein FF011L_06260 [Roseimaritima multifibrata]
MPETTTERITQTAPQAAEPNWLSGGSFYDQCAEEELARRLDEIQAMDENWDGQGASAVNSDCISYAKMFCRRSVSYPVPKANPTSDGGVQLEWHVDDRSLEIEFDIANGQPVYICWDRNGAEPVEGEITIEDDQKVNSLISWVTGR